MVGGEAVLEANLEVAGFASAGVGKGQNLLAAPDGASRFLVLGRVTGTRVLVGLEQGLVVVVLAGGFDGGGAGLANEDSSAVVVGFGAVVGLVRSMLQAKDLATTIAVEG